MKSAKHASTRAIRLIRHEAVIGTDKAVCGGGQAKSAPQNAAHVQHLK
jgi:hypothetical protein